MCVAGCTRPNAAASGRLAPGCGGEGAPAAVACPGDAAAAGVSSTACVGGISSGFQYSMLAQEEWLRPSATTLKMFRLYCDTSIVPWPE